MTHNEIRIFGPPGCGKTTRLKNLITEECNKNGSEGVLVASYTKAAARVLVERELPLEPEQVSTLHSHCNRMLATPELALKEELREEFNRLNRAFAIAPPRQDISTLFNDDQEKLGEFRGEEDFRTYEMFRARMVPRSKWPTSILAFARKWEEFKEMTGSIDFTDMIFRSGCRKTA